VVGYGPFSLCVIHKEGLCSCSGGINRLVMMMCDCGDRLRPMLHSFAIDLMDSAREWPYANVLVHANVRAHVDSQLGSQLVVLNAWLGAWGPERRQRTARLVPAANVRTSHTFTILLLPPTLFPH
jgi:hypothetical protein